MLTHHYSACGHWLCNEAEDGRRDDAVYRQRQKSAGLKRMCDFAVAGRTGKVARYNAIEMKAGEPYLDDAGEQLREGLRVIVKYLAAGPRGSELRAYLVVGRKSPRLIRLARTAEGRLDIGGSTIQIELVDCHGTLPI